jgi:hypothetical protein
MRKSFKRRVKKHRRLSKQRIKSGKTIISHKSKSGRTGRIQSAKRKNSL